MRSLRIRTIILSTCIGVVACSAGAPTTADPTPATSSAPESLQGNKDHCPYCQLTQQLQALITDSRVPGAAVALVKEGELEYANAFGLAEVETNRAMTTTTPVAVQSISKIVIAVSLMQLWERNKFDLDDPIDKYLSYSVRNPGHPDAPITFRMAMAHASSIADNWNVINFYVPPPPTISISDFVQSYFDPMGSRYDDKLNFLSFAPGTDEMYGDMNFTLLGAVLERLSGETIQDYTQKHVFAPLEMQARWNVASMTESGFGTSVMGYSYDATSDTQTANGSMYTTDAWPAGGLSTDVVSLSHLMIALMNDGAYRRGRILKPSTVSLMKTNQYPELVDWGIIGGTREGLGVDMYQPPYTVFDDHLYVGHWGAGIGYTAAFWIRPDADVGAIALFNGDIMYLNGQSFSDGLSIVLDIIGAGTPHH